MTTPRLIHALGLLLVGILVPTGLIAEAAPAGPANAPASDKVNMVIIYGDDQCPQSSDDVITVCARKAESERYRIPAPFRGTPSHQDEAWTKRVIAYERVSASGTNSCSPVGAGGGTGCTQQLIHNAYAERKTSSDVQFSKMIDEARQKRLSTIDAQAAQQQAEVEAAEKDYDARQRKAQDPNGDAPPPTAPLPPGTALPPPDGAGQ